MVQENINREQATKLLQNKLTNSLTDLANVKSFLVRHKGNINFEHGDGQLFGLAMEKSPELLKVLLNAYVQDRIQNKENGLENIRANHNLKRILEQQVEESVHYELDKLPEDLQEILRPWMPEDVNSEADERDLADFEDIEDWQDNSGADNSVLGDGNEQQSSVLSEGALAHHNSIFNHPHNPIELLGSA